MTTDSKTETRRHEETIAFVERALIDFELQESFYARSGSERGAFLRWIDGAVGQQAQEECVSEMLDCLAFGLPLPGPA